MQEETNQKVSQKPSEKSENIFADFDFESLKIEIQKMFKAGVYFGHQKSRRNPKMDQYIFGVKNGVNIIDLEKTVVKLKEAQDFIKKLVAGGEEILLVGTKKQAKKIVEDAGKISEMPYVVDRWLGGTITNFSNIAKRIKFLNEGEEKLSKGEYAHYTKFERMKIGEELEKLEEKIGGIRRMKKIPGAIFITGVNEDNLALKEALKKNIPVIALVDTNVNPEGIDYPIPANEDAVSSLRLMLAYIVQAILEGKKKIS